MLQGGDPHGATNLDEVIDSRGTWQEVTETQADLELMQEIRDMPDDCGRPPRITKTQTSAVVDLIVVSTNTSSLAHQDLLKEYYTDHVCDLLWPWLYMKGRAFFNALGCDSHTTANVISYLSKLSVPPPLIDELLEHFGEARGTIMSGLVDAGATEYAKPRAELLETRLLVTHAQPHAQGDDLLAGNAGEWAHAPAPAPVVDAPLSPPSGRELPLRPQRAPLVRPDANAGGWSAPRMAGAQVPAPMSEQASLMTKLVELVASNKSLMEHVLSQPRQVGLTQERGTMFTTPVEKYKTKFTNLLRAKGFVDPRALSNRQLATVERKQGTAPSKYSLTFTPGGSAELVGADPPFEASLYGLDDLLSGLSNITAFYKTVEPSMPGFAEDRKKLAEWLRNKRVVNAKPDEGFSDAELVHFALHALQEHKLSNDIVNRQDDVLQLLRAIHHAPPEQALGAAACGEACEAGEAHEARGGTPGVNPRLLT